MKSALCFFVTLGYVGAAAIAEDGAAGGESRRGQSPERSAASDNPSAVEQEIADLIRQLGSPTFEERMAATRRLTILGLRARPRLETAAKGGDYETALRAKELLVTFDRLLLAGVDVTLSLSQDRVPWDRPVDLIVHLKNRTNYPARVPFEQSAVDAASSPGVIGDAEQVGRVLDIADWLIVRGPDGRSIELRVDDIAVDPEVVAAVNRRLNTKLGGLLAAGTEARITIPAINRGWARFPTLEEGDYRFVFDYLPQWDDDVLRSERAGRVTSAPAGLTVVRSAPRDVNRIGPLCTVSLRQNGNALKATLTNATDQALWVNKNYGVGPPFADARWVYRWGESAVEVRVAGKPGAALSDFDGASFVEVAPGDSHELAAVELTELRKQLAESDADLGQPGGVIQFRYANLTDRQWQNRQGTAMLGNAHAPPILQTLLPRQVLTTTQTSNEVSLSGDTP